MSEYLDNYMQDDVYSPNELQEDMACLVEPTFDVEGVMWCWELDLEYGF